MKPSGFALSLVLLAMPAFAADPAGVPNYHQVNDRVCRGGQPSEEGFKNLAKMGVKTVINLRAEDEMAGNEKKIVEAAGMKYVGIPMRGMSTPNSADVAKVLKIFEDEGAGTVFVHCRRGADRTGTVVACYRISHDRWENKKALNEARSLGMSWIERAMQHFVMAFTATGAVAATASN